MGKTTLAGLEARMRQVEMEYELEKQPHVFPIFLKHFPPTFQINKQKAVGDGGQVRETTLAFFPSVSLPNPLSKSMRPTGSWEKQPKKKGFYFHCQMGREKEGK
jgi:hypothetical protein